ncbi:MarR family transcriptional regulator [Streptomyces sp. NBC_01476]|uniref:MarR family winged helix-turn-helix transcriptional regulator n=1 Tax=Streptomyces sp. NBC_01476 TaxID=2903881 RepID=UPI002E33871B|nr:MarR family transcriptional regulator [Streptomyces sp. NBC_01476]
MNGEHRALDVIEYQSAVLVRNFELLHRRTDVHDELDRAEYLLLRILAACGPQDINSLAALLGLDPSTAGRQVTSLRKLGLVAKSPAEEDRRRSIITPTEEGLHLMEEVRTRRARNHADLLEGWSEEDLRTLATMFTKYNRAVAAKFLTDAPAPAPA